MENIREDDRGLFVEGKLWIDGSHPDPDAMKAYRGMKKEKGKMGLSIGYSIPDNGSDIDDETGIRDLEKINLWEVSPTVFPMNEAARVDTVKSTLESGGMPTEREIEKLLRDVGIAQSEQKEHKDAFLDFMKAGTEEGLRDLERKAMSIGSDPDGGYAVPEELDRNIYALQREATPMRAISTVQRVSNENYKKLVNLHGAASGWVGETAARTETGSPTLAELTPSFGEIYANPAATQRSLDDVFFDAEEWLAQEVAMEFSEKENLAFTSGNGTNKPKGILDYLSNTTADGTRAFGTLQQVNTGVSGDFAAADPHNIFIDAVYALKAAHRGNSRWVINKSALASVRKMQDGNGNLIWQPGLSEGQPQTLMGYPVTENEDMPNIAANSSSIAFGDFKRGYQIVDIVGTRVLRDPYTNKPYVHFYTTKRVGGHVVDLSLIHI